MCKYTMFVFDTESCIVSIDKKKTNIEQMKEYMKKKYNYSIQNDETLHNTILKVKTKLLDYM